MLPAAVVGACAASPAADRASATADAATDAATDAANVADAATADYLLLGEVHDHPEGHDRRLALLRALAIGPRRAILLEQFDTEHAAAIARWQSMHPDARGTSAARALAEAGGFDFDGWHWPFYAPIIELALERRWTVGAANLSRRTAMRLARTPVEVPPPPAGWTEAQSRAIESAVRIGHCGMLPESRIAAMGALQRSRDAHMAIALRAARADGHAQAILVAGNGHVRSDHGVPAHLRAAEPGARIVAVGFVETGGDAARVAAFDRVEALAPHRRPDPCEGLRERLQRPARESPGMSGARGPG